MLLHSMGFGEDLRGELFGKLGVESETDPSKLIDQGRLAKREGNNQGAKKAFAQALQLADAQAEKYASQNQHRSAAEAYYLKSIAQGLLEKADEQSETYSKVIDRLLEAAKTAMAFGEDQRGIACATLAGMVALMDSDQLRGMQIYSDHLEIVEEKPNSGLLQKLLYSLGYLLDALKNDNIAAITDAQNYISTDLRPMLSGAKLNGFESLLDSVLSHTQDLLQSRITMPKIQIATSLPRDIQFNQIFDLDLNLSNSGDGIASDVKLEIDIPNNLEVVDGKPTEELNTLDPEQEEIRKIKMRFLTGDPTDEEIRELKGKVSYVDMLGNSHSQYFGPMELTFTAISKKEEYQGKLRNSLAPLKEITSESLHNNVLPASLNMMKSYIDKLESSVREKIDDEEFDQVEFGLQSLEDAIEQVQKLTTNSQLSQSFSSQVNEIVEKEKQKQKQELEESFEEEKTSALDDLREKKDNELQTRVDQLKSDLTEQHTKELNSLKDKQQHELQQIQQTHENNLKKGLVKHENKLKEEFKLETQKLKDDHEKELLDLKSHHKQDLQKTKSELQNELSEKYEARIADLEKTVEDLKTQITSQE